jgi:hypothetical protein
MLKTTNDIEEYKYKDKNKDLKDNSVKLFNDVFRKNEHRTYVKYLVGDEFAKKHDELEEQVELIITDRLPKTKNSTLYTYIALTLMVILQIVILVVKG